MAEMFGGFSKAFYQAYEAVLPLSAHYGHEREIGIIWQMGGVAMQFVVFSDLPSSSKNQGFENFELMSNVIRLFSIAIAIVISGLFVWIIKKLATQPILGEFVSSKSNKTTP